MNQSVKQIKGNIANAARFLHYAQSQVIRVILFSDDIIVMNAHIDNFSISCTIMNLNEFITEDILEHLRQHGMRPIKCALDSLFFRKIKELVTLRLSDVEKLSNSNI